MLVEDFLALEMRQIRWILSFTRNLELQNRLLGLAAPGQKESFAPMAASFRIYVIFLVDR